MKQLTIILTTLVIFLGVTAHADVCITETYSDQAVSWGTVIDQEQVYLAAYTCKELENVNNGLQAVAISFSAGGIYAACTGIGLPATVTLEGGALFLSAVGLLVSNLDCEDTEQEAMIKKQVDEAVCLALESQGLECRPPLQQLNNDSTEI